MAPVHTFSAATVRAWQQVASGVLVPSGLIVPYLGSTAPAGWSKFTPANGKTIAGAGGTYSVGEFGTDFVGKTVGSSTGGAHSAKLFSIALQSTGTVLEDHGDTTVGSHNHTFSYSFSIADVYKTYVLLKAGANTRGLPPGALLLATTNLNGLNNLETAVDRFLRANTTAGITGGSSIPKFSAVSNISTAGAHKHGSKTAGTYVDSDAGGSTLSYTNLSAGAHNGHNLDAPPTVSGNLNTKRIYVSAWGDATKKFDLVSNGIAMYEGTTAPAGWRVCNGTLGTPDMRGYFVRIGNTTNHGSTGGDNSFVISYGSSSLGSFANSHTHKGGGLMAQGSSDGSHETFSATHTHTIGSGTHSGSAAQAGYALTFIQYIG